MRSFSPLLASQTNNFIRCSSGLECFWNHSIQCLEKNGCFLLFRNAYFLKLQLSYLFVIDEKIFCLQVKSSLSLRFGNICQFMKWEPSYLQLLVDKIVWNEKNKIRRSINWKVWTTSTRNLIFKQQRFVNGNKSIHFREAFDCSI